MGIFNLFNNANKLSRGTIEYLNKVDLEYMRAYATKTTRNLHQYFDRDCIVKVSRLVLASNSRYFGAEKFRKTTWTIESSNETEKVIRKRVEFDKVRVCSALSIDVAENYCELWTLSVRDNIIKDIQKVS